jgi:hypothetical protein
MILVATSGQVCHTISRLIELKKIDHWWLSNRQFASLVDKNSVYANHFNSMGDLKKEKYENIRSSSWHNESSRWQDKERGYTSVCSMSQKTLWNYFCVPCLRRSLVFPAVCYCSALVFFTILCLPSISIQARQNSYRLFQKKNGLEIFTSYSTKFPTVTQQPIYLAEKSWLKILYWFVIREKHRWMTDKFNE